MIEILMVEDDVEIAQMLTEYLARYSMHVTTIEDPFLAQSALAIKKYDLVILDLTLPGLDGLEVCKALRKHSTVPIIISSARSDLSDKVAALELGADDYLPKPYDPRELEVRIKTILRRYQASPATPNTAKIFTYDESKMLIAKEGEPIRLTAAEFEVLLFLLKREGFIVSEEIFDATTLLRADDENSSSLTVIINRLRHKIETDSKHPRYLQTIRGMGYKFVQ